MGRPRKNDNATDKWLADLAREHGPRGAVVLAEAEGRRVSLGAVQRAYARCYPGESADPAGRPAAPAPAAAPVPVESVPPPARRSPPGVDELLAAKTEKEILIVVMRRAAEMATSETPTVRFGALDRVLKVSDRLAEIEKAENARQEKTYRIVELRLPPKEPPP